MDEFINSEKVNQLKNEYEILHLIYHRNRNQHRSQIWWKYLNIVHRNIRKIIKLLIDIERIKCSSRIHYKKQEILDIIKYLIKKKVITKSYYEFNGIISLGQFLNLGLTLIGNLSKIYAILIEFKGVKKFLSRSENSIDQVNNAEIIGDDNHDMGEIIDIEESQYEIRTRKIDNDDGPSKWPKISYDIEDIFGVSEMKNSKKKEKPTDSKSPAETSSEPNAIDDIFGVRISKKKKTSSNSIDDIFNALSSDNKSSSSSKKKEKRKKRKRNEIDDIFG